jgi:hypothetical protein
VPTIPHKTIIHVIVGRDTLASARDVSVVILLSLKVFYGEAMRHRAAAARLRVGIEVVPEMDGFVPDGSGGPRVRVPIALGSLP